MGKVIDMKRRRCRRCGKPTGSLSRSCRTAKCIVEGIRARQRAGKVTEIPSIEIVLCETEAKAVRKNPRLMQAFQTIARAAVENYFDGLPRTCPKTDKPHRYTIDQDETYCLDCHANPGRGDKEKPYVKEVVLHYRTQASQPYGSESRKCTECGTRLWIPSDGTWTDDHVVWKDPPKGLVNCRVYRNRP